MSETKQSKVKRTAPRAMPPTEPVAALPKTPAVPALPAPYRVPAGGETFLSAFQASFASLGASQSAVASDVNAMALEMNGLARSNLTAATDSVAALLAAKSLADAVEVQLGFVRRCLDAAADGSTRLGKLGLKLALDASRPMLTPFAAR